MQKYYSQMKLSETEFCVLDFETTGTSAKSSRAIEIGIVKIQNLKIVDKFQSFINPGRTIPYYITELTGISTWDIADAPGFNDIADSISKFIGNAILVAHNMTFDHSFFRMEYTVSDKNIPTNPTLCTLKLARKLYPHLPSKALGNLAKQFRLLHHDVHRALGDAMVTAKLLLKMINELQDEHRITTAGQLLMFQGKSTGKQFKMIKKSLSQDLNSLPNAPGVYFFKNKMDEIIYIGKAKSIRKRVNNYFANTADKKAKNIVRKASKITFERTNTELTALLTEATLIKKINPPFNSQLKRYSQQYFIKIKLNHKVPNISSTQTFDFNGNDYFGPYNNRDTVQALVEIINRSFKLRECTEKEFSKKKPCYLYDIKRCSAPCSKELYSKVNYDGELRKVYDFLEGNSKPAINSLLQKMKQLSETQKYEEASEIRDTVNLILNQLSRTSILSEPINKANVLLEITENVRKDYLLFLEGQVFIKNFSPDKTDKFVEALSDHYYNVVTLFNGINQRDLEQIKITLSWFVKNRNSVKMYYLKDYESKKELELAVKF